jgi:hypothetical protein
MGKARTIRLATALTVIGVGVPLTVIANSRGTQATDLAGSAVQAGSQLNGATGSSATSAGTSAGTASSSSTPSASSTTHYPADKMTVAASKLAQISPQGDVVLLSGKMRTSNPADLTFSVTLECSILTAVANNAKDSQTAEGQVQVWIEVDGKNVGVEPAQPGQGDDGKVTFCNRTYTVTTNFTNESGDVLDQYIATKDANAFNWEAMNVGAQVHTIEVHATLTASSTDPTKDQAQAEVGNRTLVVNTTENAQNQAQ